MSGQETGASDASKKKSKTAGSTTLIHLPKADAQKDIVPSFGAVLRKYRNKNGMSQPELAEIMGISRNTITNWENDRSRPEVDSIRTLCTMFGIPLYELFGLSNDSLPSPHENVILRQYRQLSPVGRKVIDKVVASMLEEETDARDQYLRDSFFVLPLESTSAAAGPGCEFVDMPPEYIFIKKNGYNESADALVRVSGASMEPHYHNGDLVYIKYTNTADDGDDVICSTADGAVMKRLSNHKLYSLNKALPFGEKNEDDHVVILGRVIGIVSDDELPDDADIPTLEEMKSEEIREFNRSHGCD